MGNIVDPHVRHLKKDVDPNLKGSAVAPKGNIVDPNLKGSAVAPEGNIVDPIIDIDDPCWQLFCLEHGIDPVLGAQGSERKEGGHRPRHDPCVFGVWSALVTRLIPAKSPEFHSQPCTEALDKELGTLRSQGVWDEDGVREWRSVRIRSGADGKDDLVGRLFAIMGEKNAEDGVLPHLRKYKARIVFAGNNIQTASGTQAHELFQELSQTPAAMGSVRAALGIAALQGHIPKVRDATQAYIQARIDGPDRPRTWVRLPRQWWPAAWFDASGKPLYDDPVVPLVRALYGHPESGALWDAHLGAILTNLGWTRMEVHPGLWLHKKTGAVMAVYVDDLLLAAGKNDEARLWKEIEHHVKFGEPATPISKFLGGHHKVVIEGGVSTLSTQMKDFLLDAAEKFRVESGAERLASVRTPYLDEDFTAKGAEGPGVFAGSASSHLMKVLFAARLCRPDLLVAITRLASKVSAWQKCHDRALRRLFQYIAHHADLELVGSLDVRDKESFKLIMSPDADLAGDLETTKSTSGLWIELQSADGKRCWPIAWRSKRQGSTASSTCEAETISMATALKSEALPLLELFSEAMNRRVMLECREDNTQCISAVRTGYSAALRHLPRTERIAVGVVSETFASDDCHIVYQESALHKGDVFTKRLSPAMFEPAIERLGLRRPTASGCARPASR